jgi:hypothetical protein
MDSSEQSSQSLLPSPTADDIPSDIVAEFKRVSDDADALLQSIRNDEVKAATSTPKRRTAAPAEAEPASSSTSSLNDSTQKGVVLDSVSPFEDDDMTDELHRLEAVPYELRQLQKELDGIDHDRLKELIHGTERDESEEDRSNSKEDVPSNDAKEVSSPTLSAPSSASPTAGTSCSASAAPHFALGNASVVKKDGKDPGVSMYCQEVVGGTDGKPRQRRTNRSSGPSAGASKENAPPNRESSTPGQGASQPPKQRGVLYPYDPAVAELRALMKGVGRGGDYNDGDDGNPSPPITPPSRGRVLKPAPPSFMEAINWTLVGAFAIVWATVVVLMSRRSRATEVVFDGAGDSDENVIQLPAILR